MVRSICNHEPTLGLRPVQFKLCALFLGSSPRPMQRPSDYQSFVYTVLRLKSIRCVLAIYLSDVCRRTMRYTLEAHFCSSITLGIAFCLHNPQTEVYPLCARAVLGTTIGVAILQLYIKTSILSRHDSWYAVCLHSPQTGVCPLCTRTLSSLNMSLGIVVHLCSPQTEVCSLHAEVPSWLQPSASPSITSRGSSLHPTRFSTLPYVFTALRLKSVCCVLGLVFCLTRPSV